MTTPATFDDVLVHGALGIGTTAPTHPLHVAKAQGIRQNELYLSSAGKNLSGGEADISYNAHLNENGNAWVFPDPSRPAVSVQMYSRDGAPKLDVYTTTRQNTTEWRRQLAVDGNRGVVTVDTLFALGSASFPVFARSHDGPAGLFDGGLVVQGDLFVSGVIRGGSKQFQIDHPLDPANKFLHHSAVECDEMKNLYDGVADLDADGRAEVLLPDWFEALNENFRYQLTPIGAPAPDLHIASELRDGRFSIAGGSPNTKVCWQVSAVRHDAYAQAHPLQVEAIKSPDEAGLFVHPKEHNEPAERSLATLFTPRANDSDQG